jgi:hypothetical protein
MSIGVYIVDDSQQRQAGRISKLARPPRPATSWRHSGLHRVVGTDRMEDQLLLIVRKLLPVLMSMSFLGANELSPAPVYRIHSS